MHELSEIREATENQRSLNSARGISEEDVNKGFKKVFVKEAPDYFLSFNDDEITGYVVDLNFINLKDIQSGRQIIIDDTVTFGKEDAYIYDAAGEVYYLKGLQDDKNVVHFTNDEELDSTSMVMAPDMVVSATLGEGNKTATIKAEVTPKHDGEISVKVSGAEAEMVARNTFEHIVNKNGTYIVVAREKGGRSVTKKILVQGIEGVEDTTPPEVSASSIVEYGRTRFLGTAFDGESNITGYAFIKSEGAPKRWTTVDQSKLIQNGGRIEVEYEPLETGTYYFWARNEFGLMGVTTVDAVRNDQFIILYNANGGTNTPPSQVKNLNESIVLSSQKPTRLNYVFVGWGTSSISSQVAYNPGDTYNQNDNLTLYAIWKKASYTITYNANGGTGAPSSQTANVDSTLKISGLKPTREGYVFAGWGESDNSSEVLYTPNQTYTQKVDITLYAIWSSNEYTVTYNANFGDGAPAPQTKYHGLNLTLSSARPVREGYTFLGWSESSTATNSTYQPGDAYTSNKSVILYAVWSTETFTIRFNPNSGSDIVVVPADVIKNAGVAVSLPNSAPQRSGYTFLGWSDTASDDMGRYSPGSTIDNDNGFSSTTKTMILYAIWQRNTFTITYDANGGEGAPPPVIKNEGQSIIISDAVPTKTGYAFLGWAVNSTATVAQYVGGDAYVNEGNVRLYAVWSQNSFTVSYNANGGAGAPGVQTKNYGTSLVLSDVKPVRDGYEFIGWSTDSSAEEAEYRSGGTYSVNESAVLYAVWKKKSNKIEYDANGGTGAPDDETKDYGEDYTISNVAPIREGHDFIGWSTSSTATIPTFIAGDNYSDNEDLKLYAIWSKFVYNIYYDANEGHGAPANVRKTYDELIKISTTKPERNGYTFVNWNTEVNGVGNTYVGGQNYSENADLLLYAQWNPIKYTITYDVNGGVGNIEDQEKYHDKDIFLRTTSPSYLGHTFLGWSENKLSTSADFSSGSKFTENRNLNLYAVYRANTFTITFDLNGAEGTILPQTKTYGEPLTLRDTKPERQGYDFLGWSKNPNAVEPEFRAGGSFGDDEDTTLYAVWKVITYNIKYDANGGDVSSVPEVQEKEYGTAITLRSEEPTREGYSFVGWNENASATTKQYSPRDTFTDNKNATLYAIWKINTYTITFNVNGGTPLVPTKTKEHDVPVVLPDTILTKEGYTFLGWDENPTSDSPSYLPGATYENNGDVTLYAIYKIDSYPIYFYANEPVDGQAVYNLPSTQYKEHNVEYRLPSTAPITDGYEFLGWGLSANATEVGMQPGWTYDKNESLSLYAMWKVKEYHIRYNKNTDVVVRDMPEPQTKIHGIEIRLSDATPSRDNYNFGGWAISNNSSVATYNPGDTYNVESGIELFAVWLERDHQLIYDANGGTGAPSSMTFKTGRTLIVSSGIPQNDGHDFLGWNEDKNATTATKHGGDEIVGGNTDITLYAIWDPHKYEVSFNANGGQFADNTTSKQEIKVHGVALAIPSYEPSLEGHTFKGWGLSQTATQVRYKYNTNQGIISSTYQSNSQIELFAVWELDNCEIVFNSNGGQSAPAPQLKYYNQDLTITDELPTRLGFTFLGWSTSASSTTIAYRPGDTYTANNCVNLFAVWTVSQYTITYNANGGTFDGGITTKTQGKLHGTDVLVISDEPTKSGQSFRGWSKQQNATSPTYFGGDVFSENSDVTLYAVYGIQQFNITYNANGKEASNMPTPNPGKKDFGSTYTIPNFTPTCEDSNFVHWSTLPSEVLNESGEVIDTGVIYEIGDTYTSDSDLTLFAVWTEKKTTITYVANNGTSDTYVQELVYGDSVEILNSMFNYPGYTFVGWGLSASATTSEIEYYIGDEYSQFTPLTLYAVWELAHYNITYDLNGGVEDSAKFSALDKTHGIAINVSSYTPEREGYDFSGWARLKETNIIHSLEEPPELVYSGDENLVVYHESDAITENYSMQLKAVWSIKQYTISFNGKGGSPVPGNITKNHFTAITIPSSPVPTKAGYDFKGWVLSDYSTNEYTGNIDYPTGTTYDLEGNRTLYAAWTLKKYNITFNANAGSDTVTNMPSTIIKTHGVNVSIPGNEPIRSGYTFLGWALTSGASSAQYTAGNSFNIDASTPLYAVWKAITYSITYNLNGGSVSSANPTSYTVATNTFTLTNPTRTDYNFDGWSGTGLTGTTNQTVTISKGSTGNRSYTANWSPRSFLVTLDNQGATTAGTASVRATYGSAMPTATMPTKTGHTFGGYFDSKTGGTQYYNASGGSARTWNKNSDATLYARWTPITYTISFNANAGSDTVTGLPNSQTKTHGQNLTLSSSVPNRAGYLFKGWARTSSATTKEYEAGGTFDRNEDTTLYAVWEEDNITITYVVNGGSGSVAPQTKLANVGFNLSTTTPTSTVRRHYFAGWTDVASDAAEGVERVKYTAGQAVSFSTSKTLYAVYKFVVPDSVANAPVVGSGMSSIYFSGSTEYTGSSYNYTQTGHDLTDAKNSYWANAKTTEDGSYWVWIPRYAYKITYGDGTTSTSTSKTEYTNPIVFVDILFLNGTSNQYKSPDGSLHNLPAGYIVHPAFQKMTTTDDLAHNPLGKWDSEIRGFWAAKFEMSRETKNKNGVWVDNYVENGTTNNLTVNNTSVRAVSKPNVSGWANTKNTKYFTNSLLINSTLNSHMMKNSEWGAVAYLAASAYGRNSFPVWPNAAKSSVLTGYGGMSDNPSQSQYTQTSNLGYAWTGYGSNASTTGNIYGVYDMAGGRVESIVRSSKNKGSNDNDYKITSDTQLKYVQSASSYSSTVYGDAMYETSTDSSGTTSFHSRSYLVSSVSAAHVERGSTLIEGSKKCGIFAFDKDNGSAEGANEQAFRAVLIVN